jgi:pimeloyl-ACP methyl ester carboxylesterase
MRRIALTALAWFLLGAAPVLAQKELLSVDDVTLRYEVAGKGPAVVLLHGWAQSRESWHFLFPELPDEYTVIRYDLRGFGQSGGSPDESLDPIDVRNLLDSLGLDRAVVAGHSRGARSALRFALAFPERLSALVLYGCGQLSGFGLPRNGPDALPSGLVQTARELGPDAMRARFDGHPIANGFVEGTEGLRIFMAMWKAFDARGLLDPKPSAEATPPADVGRLVEVVAPTLVITGEMEMPYNQILADALAYGIPNAERVVVPGGGHSVHLQQPERFNGEFKRFLTSVFR